MSSPNPLHEALIAKLRTLQPLSDFDSLSKTAQALIATGALGHDGERVRITGSGPQVTAATRIHAALIGAIRGDFVGALPETASPIDRAAALLSTHGMTLADAFTESQPVLPRDTELVALAREASDPIDRTALLLRAHGIDPTVLGSGFGGGGEAA